MKVRLDILLKTLKMCPDQFSYLLNVVIPEKMNISTSKICRLFKLKLKGIICLFSIDVSKYYVTIGSSVYL